MYILKYAGYLVDRECGDYRKFELYSNCIEYCIESDRNRVYDDEMNGFNREIKEDLYRLNNLFCDNCLSPAVDIHHKLPNTKTNRMKYPLFTNSVFNGVALCRTCHEDCNSRYKITDKQAEIYEKWLQKQYSEGRESIFTGGG